MESLSICLVCICIYYIYNSCLSVCLSSATQRELHLAGALYDVTEVLCVLPTQSIRELGGEHGYVSVLE